jgi:Bacterial Ig-like domain (group 3)
MRITTYITAVVLGSIVVVGGTPLLAVRAEAAFRPAPLSAASHGPRQAPKPPVWPTGQQATTTTLVATLSADPRSQLVTITVTVSAATGGASGCVTVTDGPTVVAAHVPLRDGVATVSTNALGPGPHVLVASFAGAPGFAPSSSAPVPVGHTDEIAPSAQTVVVTIPAGSITITTPYMRERPLELGRAELIQSTSTYSARARVADIVITDTRPGNLGFTASVVVGRFADGAGGSFEGSRAGLIDLAARQVPNNAMRASDVHMTDTAPAAPGLGSPRVFARYPAGRSIGTVHVQGTFALAAVPSSVHAGVYVATVTFTAI